MKNVGAKPYVWMLCGCAWFSLMGVLAHDVGGAVDWQIAALARSCLATFFALGIAVATGAKLVFLRPRVLWLRSIAGSCSMLATFYSLARMEVSDVLTITNTFPIWVALLSWPMTGERPTIGVAVAVVCSVIGVGLTQHPTADGFPPAAWAALAASVFTAIAMLGLNRLKGVSALGIVVHFSAVATLFCGAGFLLFDRTPFQPDAFDASVFGKLLGVGATATIGQVFLTRAFRSGSATKVAVVGLSQVVMVMLFEAAFGRRFDWLAILGTALVLGPTGWVMLTARKPVEDVAIE